MAIRHLTTLTDLEEVLNNASEIPTMLFKHSTRCPLSDFANNNYLKFAQNHDDGSVVYTHLDLIAYRDVSNAIAEKTGVQHQSPQAILLVGGIAVWNASHTGITEEALDAAIKENC